MKQRGLKPDKNDLQDSLQVFTNTRSKVLIEVHMSRYVHYHDADRHMYLPKSSGIYTLEIEYWSHDGRAPNPH